MGVYLSQPIQDKISSDNENSLLKCGVSSMQGWRVSQEDAHNCFLDYDDNETSFFAVYDGHGGREVAEYTSKHFPDFLKKVDAYVKGDFENALIDGFIQFDAMLKEESVVAELRAIADKNDYEEDEKGGDEVDVQELKEEADMPLSVLIAKYASGSAKSLRIERFARESSSHPASPYLKAKISKSENELAGCSKGNGKVLNGIQEIEYETDDDKSEKKVKEELEPIKCKGEGDEHSSHNGECYGNISVKDGLEGCPDQEETLKKETKSAIRIAKKKATVSMFAQLFEDGSESDSDNDENFNASDTLTGEDYDEDDEECSYEGEYDSEIDEDSEEDRDADDEEMVGPFSSQGEAEGNDSGCTAVIALLHKNKLFVANAGDSRAVLCKSGTAIDLSVDHKPDDELERKRIEAAGGTVSAEGRVNGGLNLSRALGDHSYKKCENLDAKSQMITALPDIRVIDIDKDHDEFFVLACDGIWNSMTSQEVVNFVKSRINEEEKLSSICEKLFDKCLAPDTMGDGTGCDNMTCIIISFKNPSELTNNRDSCKRSGSPICDEANKRPKVESQAT